MAEPDGHRGPLGIPSVDTTDYHTAGEPFRIVTGGVPALEGHRILDKRRFAREHLDHIRRLLINEPRGHADMYGGFPTEPEDGGADLGVVFFHNEGFSTACGHGTIALVTWALDSGRFPKVQPETRVVVDVPSGRVETFASIEGGRVRAVRFRNVPSFVHSRGHRVGMGAGAAHADVAFGGAFYASVDARAIGVPVVAANVPRFIQMGRDIKQGVESRTPVAHPEQPEIGGIYGVIFFEEQPPTDGAGKRQRNVTVFADGEVDRSPCGSGTSARLALLHDSGELALGEDLMHEGIVGTTFRARVVAEDTVAGIPAVVTEVEGTAFPTGSHRFVLDPEDPLGTGFLLR